MEIVLNVDSPGGPTTVLVRAPGRVNIIGEHTDYNGGLALPTITQSYLTMRLSTLPPDEDCWKIFAEDRECLVNYCPADGYDGEEDWMGFFTSAYHYIDRNKLAFRPVSIHFHSDIPPGAGMSSSSALTCALVAGLNALFGWGKDSTQLVHMASQVEHGYGVQGGLLDQMAIFFGKTGQAMRIDFSDLSFDYVPIGVAGYSWVLWDSLERRSLVQTPFNQRRREVDAVLHQLGKDHWQAVSEQQLDALDTLSPATRERCRYIIRENERVDAMVTALEDNDIPGVGQLLYASHVGLRNGYEVSSPALDRVVDHLKRLPQCAGARMMGGGFGGMVISLIETRALPQIVDSFRRIPEYNRASGSFYHIVV